MYITKVFFRQSCTAVLWSSGRCAVCQKGSNISLILLKMRGMCLLLLRWCIIGLRGHCLRLLSSAWKWWKNTQNNYFCAKRWCCRITNTESFLLRTTTPERRMGLKSSDQKVPRINVEGVKIISLIYVIAFFFDLMKFFDLRDPFLVLELSFFKTPQNIGSILIDL